jgi:hypothetical protein
MLLKDKEKERSALSFFGLGTALATPCIRRNQRKCDTSRPERIVLLYFTPNSASSTTTSFEISG